MKKRSYRAQKANEVRWEEVADRVKDKAMVWAIDVAKVEQYGVLDRQRNGHAEMGAPGRDTD